MRIFAIVFLVVFVLGACHKEKIKTPSCDGSNLSYTTGIKTILDANVLTILTALVLFLFAVLGAYFVWFWSHGGQTVAMKAWQIRLLDAAGRPLPPWRRCGR